MLYPLDPQFYDRVRPVLGGLSHHLAVSSVLHGHSHGVIYVDDVDRPRAALCRCKHRFYVGGDPHSRFADGLHSLFTEEIYPQGLAAGHFGFTLYHDDHEGWTAQIGRVLAGRAPRQFRRNYYTLTALEQARSCDLPHGMSVRQINAALLAQTTLDGYSDLTDELQSERESTDDFLARSFGFCALADGALAGMCTSEFNSGTRVEVGINTMEAYQRMGVASALLWVFEQEAFAHGYTEIGWHCWSNNTASVGTALKNGFQFSRDYPVTFAYFDPAAHPSAT